MLIRSDGSAATDAPDRIVIDPTDEVDAMRYRCPNGHSSWEPTNNHIWCHSCYRQTEHDPDVDSEHYAVIDEVTGEEIPWSAVEFKG